MNYSRVYDEIIKKYYSLSLDVYTEVHHIIPKCVGGTDRKDNLIELPAKVHFVCHLLLAKIYGGKLIHAAWRMSNFKKYGSKKYAWIRELEAKIVSLQNCGRKQSAEAKKKQIENQSGEKNPFYGKKHTPESRAKMSASHSGEKHNMFGKKQSDETRRKKSQAMRGKLKSSEHKAKLSIAAKKRKPLMLGKKHSEESRAKMSESHKGKIAWNKGMRKAATS